MYIKYLHKMAFVIAKFNQMTAHRADYFFVDWICN